MNDLNSQTIAKLNAQHFGDKIYLKWKWVNDTVPKYVKQTTIFYMKNDDPTVFPGVNMQAAHTDFTLNSIDMEAKYKICLRVHMKDQWPGEKEPANICADSFVEQGEISALIGSTVGALLALLLIVMLLLLSRRVRRRHLSHHGCYGGGGAGATGGNKMLDSTNHRHRHHHGNCHPGNHDGCDGGEGCYGNSNRDGTCGGDSSRDQIRGSHGNSSSGGLGRYGSSYRGTRSGSSFMDHKRPRFDSTFDSQFDSLALREDTSFYDELLTAELSCDSMGYTVRGGYNSSGGTTTIISSFNPLIKIQSDSNNNNNPNNNNPTSDASSNVNNASSAITSQAKYPNQKVSVSPEDQLQQDVIKEQIPEELKESEKLKELSDTDHSKLNKSKDQPIISSDIKANQIQDLSNTPITVTDNSVNTPLSCSNNEFNAKISPIKDIVTDCVEQL